MRPRRLDRVLNELLQRLKRQDRYGFFLEPVPDSVPNYYEVVSEPMDFSTMQRHLDSNQYKSVADMQAEYELMMSNCILFNADGTLYVREALRLRKYGEEAFSRAKRVPLLNASETTPTPQRDAAQTNEADSLPEREQEPANGVTPSLKRRRSDASSSRKQSPATTAAVAATSSRPKSKAVKWSRPKPKIVVQSAASRFTVERLWREVPGLRAPPRCLVRAKQAAKRSPTYLEEVMSMIKNREMHWAQKRARPGVNRGKRDTESVGIMPLLYKELPSLDKNGLPLPPSNQRTGPSLLQFTASMPKSIRRMAHATNEIVERGSSTT